MKNLVKECMYIANQVGTRIMMRVSITKSEPTKFFEWLGTRSQLEAYQSILEDLILREAVDEEVEVLIPYYCSCCGSFKGLALVSINAEQYFL